MFRIKGSTNDRTECDRCGRTDLKKTIIVASLDPDGNEMGIEYLGTTCASRKIDKAPREVRQGAKSADAETRLQELRKRYAESKARGKSWFKFLSANSSRVEVPDQIADCGGWVEARRRWKESIA